MSHNTPNSKSNTDVNIKNLWATTQDAYKDACKLCGAYYFELDAAASSKNKKCALYINEDQDALTIEWFREELVKTVWCNPPFDLKREFLAHAYNQRKHGLTCMMIPYEPTTKWWREFVHDKASIVYVPDGRDNFIHPKTEKEIKGVSFASCIVVFTPLTLTTQYIHFKRGDI